MRVKELWSLVPVPQTVIKHLYTSLTLSRYTILFTISLLIYTLILSSLHVSSYVTTHTADLTLSNLIAAAAIRTNLIPVITTNEQGQDVLQLCNAIPNGDSDSRCSTVFVPSQASTQAAVPNNDQRPSTSDGLPQSTQSPGTPEAANSTPTTLTISPGDANLLAPTPTSVSSTSIPAANATSTTSQVLGIAEVALPSSSDSTTSATGLASDIASAAEINSTPVASSSAVLSTSAPATSSDTSSTSVPPPAQESTPAVESSAASLVVTTTSTTDAVTSAPPLATSSADTSTTQVVTTSTPSSKDQATSTSTTTSQSTSSTEENSTTSTSTTSVSTAQASTEAATSTTPTSTSTDPASTTPTPTTTKVRSTSTPESSDTSTSSADVNIADVEPSTTASASASGSSDGTSSIETTPLSTTSTPSSTLDSTPASTPSADSLTSSTDSSTPSSTDSSTPSSTDSLTPSSTDSLTPSTDASTPSSSTASTPLASASLSNSPETTSNAVPVVGPGPEAAQEDSPSLQPLPDVNGSSVNSPDVPTRRAVLALPEEELYSSFIRRSLSAIPVTNSTGQITGLNVTGIQDDGSQTFLNLGCAGALTLAEEQLRESWTEDLLMVGFHIWLLLLGGFAIASESIPHTLASLFSTLVALVWSASQLSESRTFRSQFTQFITDGACNGVDLLPTYWDSRMRFDVAILLLDLLAVVVFGFMGAKLVKDYRKRMSVVVGVGEERKVYKTVLVLSVVIQIGAFLQLAGLSLWVQQLFTSPIALVSSSTNIFKPLSLISILFTIPWVILGLFAIRRESKPLMLVFILVDIAFIGEWIIFFSSDVYRLVFTKWTFFAAGTVGSFAILVGCLMSGILAWMQFGRGLSEKLAQSVLDPVDTTSWDFSSNTEKAWEPFGTEKSVAKSHTLGGSIGGGDPTHQPSRSYERSLDPFSSNPGFGSGGLGIGNVAGYGYGVGHTGNYGSLGFSKQTVGDDRPGSNSTGTTERDSTAFSYGLRSPAQREEYMSRFSN